MRFISFFAGIGGIDLGLERAGHECVGQVEIDPFCIKVLEKHWPKVPRWGDITKVDANELPEADLWTGGFPCQDISNAGKRAGIHGERSGLFFDFMRLVRQVRPRYLLLENVAALLVRGMGEVLGELATSGYDATWDCIPAAAVGAPHIRNRVFVVAHTNNAAAARQREYSGEVYAGPKPVRPHDGGALLSDATSIRSVAWGASGTRQQREAALIEYRSTVGRRQWAVEPDVGRVADGIPSRVDRLKGLGNAVVPQVAEYIGRLLPA